MLDCGLFWAISLRVGARVWSWGVLWSVESGYVDGARAISGSRRYWFASKPSGFVIQTLKRALGISAVSDRSFETGPVEEWWVTLCRRRFETMRGDGDEGCRCRATGRAAEAGGDADGASSRTAAGGEPVVVLAVRASPRLLLLRVDDWSSRWWSTRGWASRWWSTRGCSAPLLTWGCFIVILPFFDFFARFASHRARTCAFHSSFAARVTTDFFT